MTQNPESPHYCISKTTNPSLVNESKTVSSHKEKHKYTFTPWVIQDLVPKLPPRSVVVMDNATFHKGADMVKALQRKGHTLLYLPPYSPDLNPIEKKWAQAKALRRKTDVSITELFQSQVL